MFLYNVHLLFIRKVMSHYKAGVLQIKELLKAHLHNYFGRIADNNGVFGKFAPYNTACSYNGIGTDIGIREYCGINSYEYIISQHYLSKNVGIADFVPETFY